MLSSQIIKIIEETPEGEKDTVFNQLIIDEILDLSEIISDKNNTTPLYLSNDKFNLVCNKLNDRLGFQKYRRDLILEFFKKQIQINGI